MFARQPIGALTGFAIGVLLTLLVFSVAFGLGRATSEAPAPKLPSPNPYPTLTSAPSDSPAPAPALVATEVPTSPSTLVPSTSTPAPSVPSPSAPPPTETAVPSVPSTSAAPLPTTAPPATEAPPTTEALPPTPAPSATATPAPATAPPAHNSTVTAEIALVNQKGYDVIDASHAQSGGPLGVLIGAATVNGDPAEYAFFFVNGQYVGTDLPQSSASISVSAQTGDTVTIRYALYRVTDPACCPSGGYQDVSYSWDSSTLAPQSSYPTYLATAPLSRR